MYQPAEDSLMLEKHAESIARGKVLDVGTGIGIQAIAAAKNKKVREILAIDIDDEAVGYCKRNIENKKIKFIKSDLFSNVKGKFDTIIFNPPYLPEEQDLKTKKSSKDFRASKNKDIFGVKDKALYGGKYGFELIKKFFSEAKSHINEGGVILLVFSSLTGKNKVDEIIKKSGFKFKELEKQHVFFEDIYVYTIKAQ